MKRSKRINRINMGFIKSTGVMMAFSILMRVFLPLTAFASPGVPPNIWQEHVKASDMVKRVSMAADIPIRFTNPDDASLVITNAKVKAVKVEAEKKGITKGSETDEYIIEPSVTFSNKGDKNINLFVLQFENTESKWRGAIVHQPEGGVGTNKSFSKSKSYFKQVGSLSTLTAMIVGVRFEDGSIWGKETFYPNGTEAPRVVRVSASTLESTVIKRVIPTCPEEAKKSGFCGWVSVSIIVDEEGKVIFAKASSGPSILSEASLQAVRQWQFKPRALSDVPVKIMGTLIINFKQ